MIGFAPEDIADLRRWAICGAVIVLAHGGIAAAMVNWQDSDDFAVPASAIVLDFAPVPVAPANQHTELPPGPEQVMDEASPQKINESQEEKPEAKTEEKVEAKLEQKVEEKVETKPLEEPPPEVAPAPNPEVAVEPPPPQEVRQETPKRQDLHTPQPITTAPQAVPDQVAAVAAAPTQGQLNPTNSQAILKWRGQIVAAIERNKHYPEMADRRGQKGVVQVLFSLDRQGRLIDSRVVRSSGAPALDEEAVAVLRRTQPFPPPPAEEFTGRDSVDLLLPMRFVR
jgi:periplasmic protein TonB